MSDCLTKKEVLHVARLARIEVTAEEIERYRYQLKTLMDDVDKIKDVKLKSEDRLIAPTDEYATLREDVPGEMLDPEEIMKNVPESNGNFIEVPVMIDE